MMAFGGEFTLGSPFADKTEVDTAIADNGMAVAVWNESGDIRGQFYAADGAEIGQVMNLATGANNQHEPDVTMDANGSFVVAWTEDVTRTNQDIRFVTFSIATGRYSGGGSGTSSSLNETEPSVAMDDNGNFVISFTRHDNGRTDTDVRFQRFNAFATRQGGTVSVSSSSSQREFNSDVAMTPDGRFVVGFEHRSDSNFNNFNEGDIRLGRFNANGTRIGTNNTVIAATSRADRDPSVSVTTTSTRT